MFAFANPRSGDGLAAGFLTDFPAKNTKKLWFEEKQQTVECTINFYNVIEKTEREKCLEDLAQSLGENDNSTRKIVSIMGGDGSLATTINFLRTNKVVDQGLVKGKVCFVMLPFGTGNDGAQVFGWGASPAGELWLQDLESLMRDIILSSTESLSLWNCKVEGQVLNASGQVLPDEILMCYYFNLGIDAEVGMQVERNRTKRRCCNYVLYAYFAVKSLFFATAGGEAHDVRH